LIIDQRQVIEISYGTIFKFVLTILLLILLYLVREVLAILLFAIIIASAVTPFSKWLEKYRFPRIFGVLILYLGVLGLAIFTLSLVIPFVSQEIGELSQTLPKLIARVSASLEQIKDESGIFNIVGQLQGFLDGLSQFLQESSQSGFGFLVSIFGGILSFIAIIVISFYLSVMKGGIDNFLRSVIPDRYEEDVLNLWHRSEKKLGRWLQAQVLLSLIVGLATYVGLSLLNIKFALVLAVLAMILELVPNVGPVLAAIPAVILGFIQSPSLGLWVVVLYIAIQQVENHLLVPLIMGKTLGLNPVVVIVSLLIGFKLAGILGMLLAVPAATIIAEFFDEILKRKTKQKSMASSGVAS